jgi:hypothetical protein
MNQNVSEREYVNSKLKEIKNLYEKKTDGEKAPGKEDLEIPKIRHRETRVKENIGLCQSRLEECKNLKLISNPDYS